MRQRPVDANQTALFVDTQPRPVVRAAGARKVPKDVAVGQADELTEFSALVLLVIGIAMLLGGRYLIGGNQYGHLTQRISDSYLQYLTEWQQRYAPDFSSTQWWLLVEGHPDPVPLLPHTGPSKRVPVPPDHPAAAVFSSATHHPARRDPQGVVHPSGDGELGEGAHAEEGGPGQQGGQAGQGPAGGHERHAQHAEHAEHRHRRGIVAHAPLLEFHAQGLIDALFPHQAPHHEKLQLQHGHLWRPMGPELRKALEVRLRVRDPALTAAAAAAEGGDAAAGAAAGAAAADEAAGLYEIPLGQVAFSRERTVMAGGEGRCMYDQHGTWQADSTCLVVELLSHLCFKVRRAGQPAAAAAEGGDGGSGDHAPASVGTDAQQQGAAGGQGAGAEGPGGGRADRPMGRYELDGSWGGPGCWPEAHWEAGGWRRLDERAHRLHGRPYLPAAARNATTVSIRHAHDPSILERRLVKRLSPHMDTRIMLHAVGLALLFLGAVLLIAVAGFAWGHARRRLAAAWHRLRGRGVPRGVGAGDEREE